MAGGTGAVEVVDVVGTLPTTTHATVRSHALVVDKPIEAGGTDAGPMASEYLAVALASCHVTTAIKIAAKRRRPIARIAVRTTLHFEDDLIAKAVLDVEATGDLDEEELATIFRLVERSCTISRAVAFPVERTLRVAPAEPVPSHAPPPPRPTTEDLGTSAGSAPAVVPRSAGSAGPGEHPG